MPRGPGSTAPCLICTGTPTWMFYGRRTCDACRNFFYKAALEENKKKIIEKKECDGDCPITTSDRKCQYCRLMKCLENGMDLNKGKVLKKLDPQPQDTGQGVSGKPAKVKKALRLSLKGCKKPAGAKTLLDSWTQDTKQPDPAASVAPAVSTSDAECQQVTEDEMRVPCVSSLHNLGNTCFLNSVVQVLRHTPRFEEKVAELASEIKKTERERSLLVQLKKSIGDSPPDPDIEDQILTWNLVRHLHNVFRKMSFAEEKFMSGQSNFIAIRPYDLLDTVELLNPMFEGNQQQDAHEFLRCLLAYVQDASRELNRYRSKSAGRVPSCKMEAPPTLFAAPKEVEMLGGCKDESIVKCKKETESKTPTEKVKTKTRTSQRLSGGRSQDENCLNEGSKVKATANGEVKSPPNRRTTKKRKSLTELQNQGGLATGQKTILDCIKPEDTAASDNGRLCNGNLSDTEDMLSVEGEREASAVGRPSNKRKTLHSESETLDGKDPLTRLTANAIAENGALQGEGSSFKKRKRSSSDGMEHSATVSPPGSERRKLGLKRYGITRNVTTSKCSTVQGNLDLCNGDHEGQGRTRNDPKGHESLDTKPVVARVQPKESAKKQTARKTLSARKSPTKQSPGKRSPRKQSPTKQSPVKVTSPVKPILCDKEAVVRLDRNAINRYFQKMVLPRLQQIERHHGHVSDCIEELFQGQVVLQTRCCECETVTERREEYQDISVAVQQSSGEEEEELQCKAGLTECPLSQQRLCEAHQGATGQAAAGQATADTTATGYCPLCEQELEKAGGGDVFTQDGTVHKGTKDPFGWVKASLSEVERLRDDNKYLCDKCCCLVEAERSMHYTSVPGTLTLHLKRFAMSQGLLGGFTKITDHVPLPLTLPCIEDNCVDVSSHRLELYGVVTHTGLTLSCGHYTAYVRASPYHPALFDAEVGHTNEGATVQQPIQSEAAPAEMETADPNNNQDPNNNLDTRHSPGGQPACQSPDVSTAVTQPTPPVYWFECDDEVINVLTEEEFLARVAPGHKTTKTPYLLFYQKCSNN